MKSSFVLNALGNDINMNDNNLIFHCAESPKSVGELAKTLDIAVKNVINRLPKLEDMKLIIVNRQGRGKKTLISSNLENNFVKEIIQLKKLEKFLNDPKTPNGLISDFEKFCKDYNI